ncbi:MULTISPECIES: hypothetical protein [unclassified Streptomyces]|uniref:hypothetical protein n=1 Tax=unclassified Streptomyces TaxID=2593676 RepID=UPI0022501546|nr:MULTISPECIES: hypothetical protein [unclassified Streptomyces]MCX5332321.1 hypothetical protein [Streptomyces sp. NBC_00140]MCX5361699.1 hypothetical protein [Streptomyces sp. NBC_00124]
MFTSWRSALSYAAIVTLVSLAVGEVGNFLWSPELLTPDRLAFPLVAIVVLVEARLLLPPLSRWSTAGIDTVLYTLVLLLVTAAEAVAYDGPPADSAFLMLVFALFTLQLPSVFALSAWRHGHLTPSGRAALTS